MPLIKCQDCGRDVSSKADQCIHCGCPLQDELVNVKQEGSKKEETIRLITPNGRIVFLKSNGTWEYVPETKFDSKGYQSVDIGNLILKIDSLEDGFKIKVAAACEWSGQYRIYEEGFSGGVYLDFKKYSKEQMRNSIEKKLKLPINVTVWGEIGQVEYGITSVFKPNKTFCKGIIVENIQYGERIPLWPPRF